MGNQGKKAKSQKRPVDLPTLQEQHRNLEAQITAEENARHPNSLAIRDLKKRKLRVKEQIEAKRTACSLTIVPAAPEDLDSGDVIYFGLRSQPTPILVQDRPKILATA